MSLSVDTLITKYVLDDQYTADSRQIVRANDRMAASMGKVSAAKSMAGRAGGLGLGIGLGIGGGAAMALVAGGLALFRAAAKHSVEIKTSLDRGQEAIDRMITTAGTAFARKLLPVINDFSSAANMLSNDGSISRSFDRIARNFATVLGVDPNKSSKQIAYDSGKQILETGEFLSEVAKAANWLDRRFNPARHLYDAFNRLRGPGQGKEGQMMTEAERVAANQRVASGMMAGATSGTYGDLGQRTLDKIERHTREMVNIQRMALGGGELGRQGVTAVDVGGMRGGRGRGGGGRVESAVRNLVDAITSASWESMDQSSRGAQRA